VCVTKKVHFYCDFFARLFGDGDFLPLSLHSQTERNTPHGAPPTQGRKQQKHAPNEGREQQKMMKRGARKRIPKWHRIENETVGNEGNGAGAKSGKHNVL
jgi:hypothetical protein